MRGAAFAIVASAAFAAAVAACSSASDPSGAPHEPSPDFVRVEAPAAPAPQPPAAPAASAEAPRPAMPQVTERRARATLRGNRAYDGAPPMIPHAAKNYAFDACLECHGPGDGAGGDVVAAPTPHPELIHCRSCHVPFTEDGTEFRPSTAERFVWPAAERAHPQAPWTIPHPATMRERCILCHTSPNLPESLRTTHPERRACRQCHVPAQESSPGPRPTGAWTGGPPQDD